MRILLGICALLIALPLEAKQCEFTVSTPNPVLLAGKKQTTSIKVAVKGFEMQSKNENGEKERAPLNIALVIDRSGSMSGTKIERAKEAAIQAIRRLDSRDIVSVITFDNNIDVLISATKVSNLENLERKIRSIQPGGTTAIYAGVEKGAEEVRKFFEKGIVNRVVLLSDGQANVGPSRPADLAELGRTLGGKGICVTTLGLGSDYNEDLMVKLASASDGNHKFIEKAEDIAEIFQKEFNTALSVVAQDVKCTVTLPEGNRPVRALNMEVDINGQEVTFGWNQIYSNHERFVMLEVEVPAMDDGKSLELATAKLRYDNLDTKSVDNLSAKIDVKFSSSESQVKSAINKSVMEDYVELIGNLNNKKAMELRDRGDAEGAQRMLLYNSGYLKENADALGGSSRLSRAGAQNAAQAPAAGGARGAGAWNDTRKIMVEEQNRASGQQRY
jgi:Ca-activated chloride channel family protein